MIHRFLSRLVAHLDGPLMGLLAVLLLISTAAVFSASGEDTDRIVAHLTNIGVALGAMLLVAHIPPQRLMQFAPPAYILGLLAYAVGVGGSMLGFGSSAGVALSNLFPEAKSAVQWLRHGWFIAVGYIVGFFALLLILGWQPHEPHKQVSGGGTPALVQPAH